MDVQKVHIPRSSDAFLEHGSHSAFMEREPGVFRQLQQGEHLKKRCKLWARTWQKEVGWAPEAG